jgi:hypothetical protein
VMKITEYHFSNILLDSGGSANGEFIRGDMIELISK